MVSSSNSQQGCRRLATLHPCLKIYLASEHIMMMVLKRSQLQESQRSVGELAVLTLHCHD